MLHHLSAQCVGVRKTVVQLKRLWLQMVHIKVGPAKGMTTETRAVGEACMAIVWELYELLSYMHINLCSCQAHKISLDTSTKHTIHKRHTHFPRVSPFSIDVVIKPYKARGIIRYHRPFRLIYQYVRRTCAKEDGDTVTQSQAEYEREKTFRRENYIWER